MCRFISRLLTLLHWSLCLFFCPHYIILIIISLKSGSVIPTALLFFSQDFFGYLEVFHFQDFFCSIFVKNAIWILMRIALNLQIDLGNMEIFKTLILPIHVHKISFNFFQQCLRFSVYRSFPSLVKFIFCNFILFIMITNGIVFLIFLSASLLLVYRNVTGFVY